MNIVVVTEYLRAKPWATARWACAIAAGLAERGHRVTVLCDGAETTTPFGNAEVVQRRPTRRHTARQPMRFARWAREQIATRNPDAAISCVRTVATAHWLAVGPRVVDEFDDLLAKRSPVSLALSLAHQPWLAHAWVAERRARWGGHAARCPTFLGFASMLEWIDDATLAERRHRARRALRLAGRVMIASVTDPDRGELVRVLKATDAAGATLLIAGSRAHAVARWAEDVGLAHRVRSVGPTSRMDDALAAADVAVASGRRDRTARFAADALRVGRPVVVAGDGASARLTAAHPDAAFMAEGDWRAALERAFDDASQAAARTAGPMLGFDAWLERLERELHAAARNVSATGD